MAAAVGNASLVLCGPSTASPGSTRGAEKAYSHQGLIFLHFISFYLPSRQPMFGVQPVSSCKEATTSMWQNHIWACKEPMLFLSPLSSLQGCQHDLVGS